MEQKTTLAPANACSCAECAGYCKRRPGAFAPEQINILAENLGLTPQALFDGFLSIDPWLGGDSEDGVAFWVIMPATTNGNPGGENAFDPRGRCVYLTEDDRCAIHEAGKPVECAHDYHGLSSDQSSAHETFFRAWDKPEHQARIRELMGCEPMAPSFSASDLFSLLTF